MNPLLTQALQKLFADPRPYIQQNQYEITTFLSMVESILRPERTVELGTWLGNNAKLLSLVTSRKTISIDKQTYTGTGRDIDLPSHKLDCILRDGRSIATPLEVVNMLGNDPIDLLFIDDGHRIEEVTDEYKVWWQYVRKGGWIAFHDINFLANQCAPGVHPDICQSHVFWKSLPDPKFELIDPKDPAAPGIGIIIK